MLHSFLKTPCDLILVCCALFAGPTAAAHVRAFYAWLPATAVATAGTYQAALSTCTERPRPDAKAETISLATRMQKRHAGRTEGVNFGLLELQ